MPKTHTLAPKLSEDALQKSCVEWFRLQYPRLTLSLIHPANGGSRNVIEATKLKRMGVVAGVCDLLLLVPNDEYHGLFIELKVGRNSLSENQEKFIQAHEKNYSCHVCYSLDEFMNAVNNYLK